MLFTRVRYGKYHCSELCLHAARQELSTLTEHKRNISVLALKVLRLRKCFVSTKATGPDIILVLVLMNLSPYLSPIIAKLLNRCLNEKCFLGLWKMLCVFTVYKNAQYRPISLHDVISKNFQAYHHQECYQSPQQ